MILTALVTRIRSATRAGKQRNCLSNRSDHYYFRGLDRFRAWWPALIMPLGLLVLVSCSSERRSSNVVFAAQKSDTVTVSKKVSASVLITSDSGELVSVVKRVRILPSPAVVDIGDPLSLSAQAYAADGESLEVAEYVWTMVDPRAGTISETGIFRPNTDPGVFEDAISVTAIQNTPIGVQYAVATTTVTIIGERTRSRLTSLAVFPENPTVLKGQIFRLTAVGFDEKGLVIPGVSFTWEIKDPQPGRVSDIGYLTVEGQQGMCTSVILISGTWEGIEISKAVDVMVVETPDADEYLDVEILPQRFHTDPGTSLQLKAIALNGLGEVVSGAELRWSMADPGAGTIDGNGVFFSTNVAGIYTEAVHVESIVSGRQGLLRAEDFSSVVVRADKSSRRMQGVRISQKSVFVSMGGSTILSARTTDEYGDPAENVAITWEMAREGVGTIDELGRFKSFNTPGIYPDAIRVVAAQQVKGDVVTKTKALDVTITGTISKIEILPEIATIAPGCTVHFRAKAYDENGVLLSGLVMLWKVSDNSIGTIDVFGNFTANEVPGMYENVIQVEAIQRLPKQ